MYTCERGSTGSRHYHNCSITESVIMNNTIFYCTKGVDGRNIPYLYYRVTFGAGDHIHKLSLVLRNIYLTL